MKIFKLILKSSLFFIILTLLTSLIALKLSAQAIPEINLKTKVTWNFEEHQPMNAQRITVMGNYLAIIDNTPDNIIKLYKISDRTFVKSFGRRGRGPNEFIAPVHIMASKKNVSRLCIYDIQLRRISCFKQSEILDNKQPEAEFTFSLKGKAGIPLRIDTNPTANKFILTGLFDKSWRFITTDSSGTILDKSSKIKHPNDDDPLPVYQHAYTAFPVSNLAGNRIAFGYFYTNRVEIYTTQGELLYSIRPAHDLFDPIYKSLETNRGPTMAQSDETRLAYIDMNSDREFIYALYSGRKRSESNTGQSNTVHLIDWEGTFRAKINLDSDVKDCSFGGGGESDQLICLSTDSQFKPSIRIYDISNIRSALKP